MRREHDIDREDARGLFEEISENDEPMMPTEFLMAFERIEAAIDPSANNAATAASDPGADLRTQSARSTTDDNADDEGDGRTVANANVDPDETPAVRADAGISGDAPRPAPAPARPATDDQDADSATTAEAQRYGGETAQGGDDDRTQGDEVTASENSQPDGSQDEPRSAAAARRGAGTPSASTDQAIANRTPTDRTSAGAAQTEWAGETDEPDQQPQETGSAGSSVDASARGSTDTETKPSNEDDERSRATGSRSDETRSARDTSTGLDDENDLVLNNPSFDDVDADGNGEIVRDEYIEFVANGNISESEAAALFDHTSNNDGVLDRQEYYSARENVSEVAESIIDANDEVSEELGDITTENRQ